LPGSLNTTSVLHEAGRDLAKLSVFDAVDAVALVILPGDAIAAAGPDTIGGKRGNQRLY